MLTRTTIINGCPGHAGPRSESLANRAPTIVQPARFSEMAASAMSVLAIASTVFAGINASRRL